jgi:hypothetical protein
MSGAWAIMQIGLRRILLILDVHHSTNVRVVLLKTWQICMRLSVNVCGGTALDWLNEILFAVWAYPVPFHRVAAVHAF